ncbi:uncharacterized protein L201_005598 [Kwoniella dendrophila CBS 6074]|uniref:non-specific serine/threonine protein kinase n=1 Tax=Kwoniella dendrophila CBS 6074 TaxID=1295534 RepID=A0AAX4JZ79_9TREE
MLQNVPYGYWQDLGRHSSGDQLCSILKVLIRQLGSKTAPLRSLAYTELLGLSRYHQKTPYTLISPYLRPISILLAENINRSLEMIADTVQFIGMTRQNFLETTLTHTLPALVLSRNNDALKQTASIVKKRLGVLLMDNIAHVLAQAFLHPDQTDSALNFLVGILQDMTSGTSRAQPNISVPSLMTACIVDLVVMLIVELGDLDKGIRKSARNALQKASNYQHKNQDVGSFLKPQMLGVISQLNDMLHDVQGKKTVEYKRKIIRSFGSLIKIAGDSMAGFSPQYLDEIVGLDDIPELDNAATQLTKQRKNAKIQIHITNVMDRAESKNVAIATASIRELKSLLVSRQSEIETLVRGDTFDPVMARVTTSLLSAVTRDSEGLELRDLSYECLGIIGALDPDRLGLKIDSGTMTIAANFTEQEESKDFALHLIRDLLVDAYRATNDTKHQTHLAYAMQELLKYCGFTPKILNPHEKFSSKIRDRWQSVPKDQLETLTPLLESRFSISDGPIRSYTHPIYAVAPTYREWLQQWTTDLIGKVMSMAGDGPSTRDSKIIFGAFRGVLKNQDVTVAHHILPHLVLNVLLSGLPNYRYEISSEINAVLQEQVNPTGPADKRTLSAQVIFDLMDHLSKWLRLFRMSKSDRTTQTRIVEDVLSSIETELMANAALQSKAYARALRSFEERIIQLRKDKRDNSELQTYFERLHQIYSELDEPDGMEGVSAFVVSPSLEHQIREHESTGRWTSAQSCWEVRLQQSPDDVTYHVGLLKCLRNLGHYGVLRRHPEWSKNLASFEAEAAWIIGDWDTVKQIGKAGPAIGQTLLALHEHQDLKAVLTDARRTLGASITSKQYASVYESILQLHLIREVEMIHNAKQDIEAKHSVDNRVPLIQKTTQDLINSLQSRFDLTSPTFRVREALLSIRRTAYSLINTPLLQPEIGDAWILTSKIARKAGYDQTAYSAVLQAEVIDAPFAFVQLAKLNRIHGGVYKPLADVDNALKPLLKKDVVTDSSGCRDFSWEKKLAKAVLLVAKWANETDRFESNQIIERYQDAIGRSENLNGTPEQISTTEEDQSAGGERQERFTNISSAMQSKRSERRNACQDVTNHASGKTPTAATLIKDASHFSSILLRFTDDKVDEKKRQMSINTDFPYVNATKTKMILPLQDALTCTLPTAADTVRSHNPFPYTPVTIAGE